MKKSKKITLLAVAFVAIVALLLMATPAGATQPEDLHCPDGWLIKWEVQENGQVTSEIAPGVTGWFSISTSGGYKRHISDLGSGDYTLTGFCVKASNENTGILPMSALPYYAGEHDISHVVVYGTKDYIPCTDTVPGEKIYTDWYKVGDEVWNPWKEVGDKLVRTGYQLWERSYTQNFYDARNREHICSVDEDVERRGQLLREEKDKPCEWQMYILQGLYYDCFLVRNDFLGDTEYTLPSRFDGTDYMFNLCALYDCTPDGWELRLPFEWTGEWGTTCEPPRPCDECLPEGAY